MNRRIYKSRVTGVATLRELLQTMFVSEVLQPGEEVWIVSPWISDVVLIDNRTGNFDALNPEWGRREIRLADVLATLMSLGAKVNVVTNLDPHNDAFRTRISELSREHNLEKRLELFTFVDLHTKGILLTRCLLMGSMNLTFNGMEINDECVELILDSHELKRTKLVFSAKYGGRHDA